MYKIKKPKTGKNIGKVVLQSREKEMSEGNIFQSNCSCFEGLSCSEENVCKR
jgi:hypothetical protein